MADAAVHDHDHEKLGFFTRWFCSTNHKDIGILYIVTAFVVGVISIAFTMYMRLELMEPGVQYMTLADGTPNGHLWNVLVTAHGITMMFFVVIPALFGGFGNFFMPLQIGAPDMAFPKINMLSYWSLFLGGMTMLFSFFLPGGAAQSGWTSYSPLANIESIKPDVLMESSSHEPDPDVIAAMSRLNGRIIRIPYFPDHSSTKIKEQIR